MPTPGGELCGRCLSHRPRFDATSALWRYAYPVDQLIHALKFSHRLPVANFIGAAMLAAGTPGPGDLLIPVPLSRQRLRQRGFNQALEVARPLARALGIPLSFDTCLRVVDTPPQSALPWKERQRNVRHAFECRADLTGKHVVVVDDVMTTGATLDEFARVLKNHGAATVTNWVCARALKP